MWKQKNREKDNEIGIPKYKNANKLKNKLQLNVDEQLREGFN